MLKKSILSVFVSSALISGCGSSDDNTPIEIPNTAPMLSAEFAPLTEKSASTLSVSASDSDGSIASYLWEQTAGPELELTGIDSAQISFTAPSVAIDTPISFKVTVTDNEGATTAVTADTNIERIENIYKLAGKVVGEQYFGAKVAATVGDEAVEGLVDETGNFSVDLAVDDDVELNSSVKLTAATESSLELASLLPSLSQLSGLIVEVQASPKYQRVASQGVQAVENTPAISVSAVSTALYSLLVAANGGEEPSNLEAFELVESQIDPDALIEAAAVVQILINSNEAILEDGADLVSVLADPAQYNALVETIEEATPGAIEAAIDIVVTDPELTPPVEAADIPSLYYQTTPVAPTFIARGGSRYEFADDNSGELATSYGVSKFTWLVEAGDILLTYTDAQPSASYPSVSSLDKLSQELRDKILAAGITQVEVSNEPITERMTRLTTGSALDTYRVESVTKVIMSPVEVDGEIITETWESTYSSDTLMRKSATAGVEFVDTNIAGLWGFEVYNDISKDSNHFEVLEFLAGGSGVSKDTGAEFDWSVTDGTLVLVFADFNQTYSIIDSSEGDLAIYAEASDKDGQLLASLFGFATQLDAATSFTTETALTGTEQYWQTTINQWSADSWDGDKLNYCYSVTSLDCTAAESVFFGFQTRDDNSGTRFWDAEGTPPNLINYSGNAMTWAVETNGKLKHSFADWKCWDKDESCEYREWRLLKVIDGRIGKRFYVQEAQVWRQNSTDEWNYYIAPRWNMYELIDLEYFNNANSEQANSPSKRLSSSPMVNSAVQRMILEPNRVSMLNQ
ncbi:PKD domain-containing protein [Shewanella sp. 0m-4]